ncbi:hypothetical protein H8959_009904 [Pygathrix nigripes]
MGLLLNKQKSLCLHWSRSWKPTWTSVYKDMVTKMQQEITFQQIMSQIANVKKDMIILEKSEFSALRAENEKVKLELHQLKQRVMDEMIKVRTDTKLDFNLEKSRVKELYSLNEKKLLELRTEIVALHAQQDRALTQTDRKIETEVAGLKTMLESHKLDNIKYLAASVGGSCQGPKAGGLQDTEERLGWPLPATKMDPGLQDKCAENPAIKGTCSPLRGLPVAGLALKPLRRVVKGAVGWPQAETYRA